MNNGVISLLPHFQAFCNSASTVLLLCGGYFIAKKKDKETHRKCMAGAFVASTFFLVSYLTYHAIAAGLKFGGEGAVRGIYFFILGTHTILAAAALPVILVTFYRAFKENFEQHKKIAPYTLGIWLYVSVTGVLIYTMLYHFYPETR